LLIIVSIQGNVNYM